MGQTPIRHVFHGQFNAVGHVAVLVHGLNRGQDERPRAQHDCQYRLREPRDNHERHAPLDHYTRHNIAKEDRHDIFEFLSIQRLRPIQIHFLKDGPAPIATQWPTRGGTRIHAEFQVNQEQARIEFRLVDGAGIIGINRVKRRVTNTLEMGRATKPRRRLGSGGRRTTSTAG